MNNWKDRLDRKTSGYEQLSSSQENVAIKKNNPNAMRNMETGKKKTGKCKGEDLLWVNEDGLVCDTKEIWQLKILSLPRNAAV